MSDYNFYEMGGVTLNDLTLGFGENSRFLEEEIRKAQMQQQIAQ